MSWLSQYSHRAFGAGGSVRRPSDWQSRVRVRRGKTKTKTKQKRNWFEIIEIITHPPPISLSLSLCLCLCLCLCLSVSVSLSLSLCLSVSLSLSLSLSLSRFCVWVNVCDLLYSARNPSERSSFDEGLKTFHWDSLNLKLSRGATQNCHSAFTASVKWRELPMIVQFAPVFCTVASYTPPRDSAIELPTSRPQTDTECGN